MNTDNIFHSEGTCKVVSKYFSSDIGMDECSREITQEKQNTTTNTPRTKSDKTRKRSIKKVKGQKDIRTLIKSKKNELVKYTKDFDLVCKESGIDVDSEQLQLAIALSKSLQDNQPACNIGTNAEKSLTCNQRRNKIRVTLQEYGFQTKKSPTKKVKKYRKHYELLLTPDTEKLQRIGENYAHILIQHLKISNVCAETLNSFDSTSSFLFNLTTNISYNCIRDDRIFYVNDLIPKSLGKKPVFKDWSKIPGRPASPELDRSNKSFEFKSIECSSEELDSILSGSLETAQNIVKNLNIVTSVEKPETEFKGSSDILLGNRTGEDCVSNSSVKTCKTMTPPQNRSCSPDLFDDEVTIIMETSNHNIFIERDVSERTIGTRDQISSMDLTECVGIINCGNTDFRKNEYLSQEKNQTKIHQNDVMDLTECVNTCSQVKSNDLCSSSGIKINVKGNKLNGSNKETAKNRQNLSQYPTLNYYDKPKCDDNNSLNNTIIMIDEENSNTYLKKNYDSLSSKEPVFIDLVEDQIKCSKLQGSTISCNNSIGDLEKSLQNNTVHNFKKTSPLGYTNETTSRNVRSSKSPDKFDTMDLTQTSNFEDCLLSVQINSIKSIITDEIPVESNENPLELNSNKVQILDHTGVNLENEMEFEKEMQLRDLNNQESMDLTQSSNSEDFQQIEPLVEKTSNNTTNDTILLNDEDILLKKVDSNVIVIGKIYKTMDLHNCSHEQNKHCSHVSENNESLESVRKENHDFDNLNVRNRKLSHCLDNSSFQNEGDNRAFDLTQHSDFCSDKVFGQKDVISVFNNSTIVPVQLRNEGTDSADLKDLKDWDDKSQNFMITNTNVVEDATVVTDAQNSDIDLTQRSDDSEETSNIPNLIEVPDELGKRNNVSIDYDEIYDNPNLVKESEIISSLDVNNFAEKENLLKEGVSGSSQHSEIFELSDNEFNYSVNHDDLLRRPAYFDIGGISTVEQVLSQDSFSRRSKLRCSCSSVNDQNTDTNEVDNCLLIPSEINENFISNNINREKSCEEVEFVRVLTTVKSKSDDNILIAKTPKHDDYVIKTGQVTPMPNYEIMTSPERNEELDKFGIKPLKRKRAIQLLTHIYNQTHPVMEVISDTEEFCSPSKKRRKNDVQSLPRRTIASQINCTTDTNDEPHHLILPVAEPNLSQKSLKSSKELSKTSKKSPEKDHIPSGTSLSNKENVLYEEITSKPDIRNIDCCPEDWIFQKREKSKVQSCRVPLHIAFHNYVSSRKGLREAILKYEPINIDDIHKGLVADGYRYNPKDLLKFMDKKCITVKTADNSRKNRNA